jgi:uncharacterized surface protein with fasciclin (FAS1) repeats
MLGQHSSSLAWPSDGAAHAQAGLGDSVGALFNPRSTITVFAPTDEAFSRANIAAVALEAAPPRDVTAARKYVANGAVTSEVAAGSVPANDSSASSFPVETLAHTTLALQLCNRTVAAVSGHSRTARVALADIPACSSVVHILHDILD